MERIQRVPRGLNELLSLAGGQTPTGLLAEVRPGLELLQLYGLNQLTVRTLNDPAAPETGTVGFTIDDRSWAILFHCELAVVGTASMTALSTVITLQRRTLTSLAIATKEFTQFGATVTGFKRLAMQMPYPLVCPPGSRVFGGIDILGTDATCNATFTAEYGLLG